ncbi:MAG: hypothetical protein ACOY31_09155 [Bacillota bacterium]
MMQVAPPVLMMLPFKTAWVKVMPVAGTVATRGAVTRGLLTVVGVAGDEPPPPLLPTLKAAVVVPLQSPVPKSYTAAFTLLSVQSCIPLRPV